MVVVVPAAGSLETCCCVGGRWANREDEPCPHVASQDALLSSWMGTISLVGWVMAGSFTNSSSRSTSNRSTLPSCKSCACSMCLPSIIRASMSPKRPVAPRYRLTQWVRVCTSGRSVFFAHCFRPSPYKRTNFYLIVAPAAGCSATQAVSAATLLFGDADSVAFLAHLPGGLPTPGPSPAKHLLRLFVGGLQLIRQNSFSHHVRQALSVFAKHGLLPRVRTEQTL
jgi:hypothetical protein